MKHEDIFATYYVLINSLDDSSRISRKELCDELSSLFGLDSKDLMEQFAEEYNRGTFVGLKSSKGRYGGLSLIAKDKASKKLDELKKTISVSKELEEKLLSAVKSTKKIIKNKEVMPAVVAADHSNEEDLKEEDGANTVVSITPSIRIYSVDSRNWTIQFKSGDLWLSKYYYSSLEQALIGVARDLFNKKLRKGINVDIKDLVSHIKSAESEILSLLKNIQPHSEEVKK